MALKTTTEQLEEVQAEISRILANGEESDLNGQRNRSARLEALTAREEVLRGRLEREQRGSGSGRIRVSIGVGG